MLWPENSKMTKHVSIILKKSNTICIAKWMSCNKNGCQPHAFSHVLLKSGFRRFS